MFRKRKKTVPAAPDTPSVEPFDPFDAPALTLAYVGDAVYELYVRSFLAANTALRPSRLHEEAIRTVNAARQAEAAKKIEPLLTDSEREVFNKGRNAKTSHRPGAGSVADYHAATALEALLGSLYLTGQTERAEELMAVCLSFAGKGE